MTKEQRLLYFALDAMTVISVGAATNALVIRNEGIQFPDGTVQTTAAGLPRRTVYLTSTLVTGNMARDQCTEPGFHMASMWEIGNWATLVEYAEDAVGALSENNSLIDLGDRLPAGKVGWVRTGADFSGSSTSGTGNCFKRGSTSQNGTTVSPDASWAGTQQSLFPNWRAGFASCSASSWR
jgi:hypothetical protein